MILKCAQHFNRHRELVRFFNSLFLRNPKIGMSVAHSYTTLARFQAVVFKSTISLGVDVVRVCSHI